MHLKDVLRLELIGSEIEVIDAKNETLKGIKGKVVDETRNTITIETKEKRKVLIKDQVTIKWKEKIVKGKNLLARPEDRLKK